MTLSRPNGDLGDRIQRSSVTTEVARRLLDYVRSGRVSPGERLPSERQLAADLGVGRSAVREALAALDMLGVVATRQGSGSFFSADASSMLPQTIEWGLMLGDRHTVDLVEARSQIEIVLAGLAAERAETADIEELTRLVAEMESSIGDDAQLVDADLRFHLHLATTAGNSVLAEVLRGIQALLRVWIARGLTVDDDQAHNTVDEHRAILAGVAAKDRDAARAGMSEHMESAAGRLYKALAAHQPNGDDATAASWSAG